MTMRAFLENMGFRVMDTPPARGLAILTGLSDDRVTLGARKPDGTPCGMRMWSSDALDSDPSTLLEESRRAWERRWPDIPFVPA